MYSGKLQERIPKAVRAKSPQVDAQHGKTAFLLVVSVGKNLKLRDISMTIKRNILIQSSVPHMARVSVGESILKDT